MNPYRSAKVTEGSGAAAARSLWRATGMTEMDFGKPIIAIANSFTQFVPGHVHLKDLGQLVAEEAALAGDVAREFNTIAVDDGIAAGHDGMLYSLPSRDLIADSIEYMVNAHCADALVCISNCDKIAVPVENQIRTYWWCSPPRIGRQRICPVCSTARENAASFSKDRCVRAPLYNEV